ncbi:hypothetical protein [Desulfuromonas acetoxidans]|uniref:Uncharacterized protein n=1 Tax=Desulfuromonas acetoxidans (strain DSM 684 / 11070) TaxID=281689 RepID=Q1K071_DESA6|nr:hypothetical protein [Desulfuromonas acetoxidans]EAT16070.1 hypothetical protein Dace_2371 [Desulfuromonas acetoxidans DSM 684]MBF0646885.1 hypothetical protein [Desulfuromonas acetoxidans]NVD26162.1 hypothetical protein [Desulfuromonas acetoxidans]
MGDQQPSYKRLRELAEAALRRAGLAKAWVMDLYPDAVIYTLPGTDGVDRYFRQPFTIGDTGLEFGRAVEVQKEFVPLRAAGQLLAACEDVSEEDAGYAWRVQVVEYGPGADGRINWPRGPLVAALNLYDGAKVFALQDSQHQASNKPFGKSPRELVGWLKNPVDTGTGIDADLCILKSAKWLRDGLVDSHERGAPKLFGLSHDIGASARTVMVAGRKMKEPVKISRVEVDVVYDPTNNGYFKHMVAACERDQQQQGDNTMLKQLLAAIKKKWPELHTKLTAGLEDGTISEESAIEQLSAAIGAVEETPESGKGSETTKDPEMDDLKAAIAKDSAELKKELDEVKQMRAAMILDTGLAASKLPEIVQDKLRRQFADGDVNAESLQAAIKEEKKVIDSLTGNGRTAGDGNGNVRMGRESSERLQAACDMLFGVTVADDLRDVPAFTSLRAAYTEMTGDTEVRGVLDPTQVQRMQAAYGSATFSYVLGNTLYRRLVQDYKERSDFGVSLLVGGNIRNAKDFRTMESVRIGYYGDLPDVNPETADYADLGQVSDEEISYALNQKGGYIDITRRMIINDDMRTVQKIINRLPRAARRTLAKRCWGKLVDNATYKGDSVALFHADHGNLGAAALTTTALEAGKLAFAQQTEPDSDERLDLKPRILVHPSELWATAKKINGTEGEPGTANFGNAFVGYFGANNENLFECPFMTDANDWMLLGDVNDCEILELAFLNGQQEPEMFVADNPTVGQMFVADKMQYKIRHEYETEIVDFRNVYKSVVV